MNDTIRMQISAYIDGELPDNESELLLRRLCQDSELRRVVARYMEIGRHMRLESELLKMTRLRARIGEELGAEPHVEEITLQPLSNRYFKPIAGFAVAASVAVLAIFGLQQTNAPTVDAEAIADSGYTQPPADDRLDEMFRLHENASGNAGSNAILTEFVTLELNEEDLVEVQPKAKLVAPIEINGDTDGEKADTDTDDTDLHTD